MSLNATLRKRNNQRNKIFGIYNSTDESLFAAKCSDGGGQKMRK